MKFTEELWQSARSTIEPIHDHPFNQELASGTLVTEKFQFYLKQDSLYLIDFARALLASATQMDPPAAVAALLPCFWIYRDVGRSIHAKSVGGTRGTLALGLANLDHQPDDSAKRF